MLFFALRAKFLLLVCRYTLARLFFVRVRSATPPCSRIAPRAPACLTPHRGAISPRASAVTRARSVASLRGRTDGGASLAANCSSSRARAGRARHQPRRQPHATEEEKRERKKRRRETGPRPVSSDVSLGNHQRYYGYRPRVQGAEPRSADARLRFLDATWWNNKKAKDVGCNDGTFSLEIARRFEPRMLLGVDADAGLIRAATALVARRAREVDPEALLAKTEVKGGVARKGPSTFPAQLLLRK